MPCVNGRHAHIGVRDRFNGQTVPEILEQQLRQSFPLGADRLGEQKQHQRREGVPFLLTQCSRFQDGKANRDIHPPIAINNILAGFSREVRVTGRMVRLGWIRISVCPVFGVKRIASSASTGSMMVVVLVLSGQELEAAAYAGMRYVRISCLGLGFPHCF